MRKQLIIALACFVLVLFGGAFSLDASAATRTVDNTSDDGLLFACSGAADDCSLRGALDGASSGDTINFSSLFNSAQTIVVGGPLIVVTNLTITGPGENLLTVSGNDQQRVFEVSGGPTIISGMRIFDGRHIDGAGGIYHNGSSLTILNCIVTSNYGGNFSGGIFNVSGSLTIQNSTISNNTAEFNGTNGAGGIFNVETMTIINSTISGNVAGTGVENDLAGGILNQATMYLINSTISGNTASGNDRLGGGLLNESFSTTKITNCTFTNNTASGAGAKAGGIYIDDRFGGVTSQIRNTIIAANPNLATPDINGAITSNGFNLIGNTSGSSGYVGTDVLNQNPNLGTLQNNGGPTATHALLAPGWPIERGDNCVTEVAHCGDPNLPTLTTDQRGGSFARRVGPDVDIGAFEYQTPTAAAARVSGQITTTDGVPLGGVVVKLSGGTESRTITNSRGVYEFEGVDTDKFYTVTPLIANYSCAPQSRSFSLLANTPDANFTAQADIAATANPLDTEMYFVRQQYLDFLGREPDYGGLQYWTAEIEKCGADSTCVGNRRIEVSAAFFVEAEFQQTGSFIYRLYRGGLGRQLNFREFLRDRTQVVGGGNLNAARVAFANAFVERPEFLHRYVNAITAESFVDALLQTMQQTSGVDLAAQRSALVYKYNSGTSLSDSRSLALREAIENEDLKRAEYTRSFVLMEYFGYLKRDPDQGGFDFWLNVLHNREPGNFRGMVCSFITSAEYQKRFSPVVTHSNAECAR